MTTRLRKLVSMAVLLALGVSPLGAIAPFPRKSPDFAFVDPSGKEVALSSFKGKVVLIEFLLIRCPHCLRVAQTVNQLNSELGPRGFQPVGVVFDQDAGPRVVTNFVEYFKITYPVGYSSSDKVDSYLGRAMMERLQVPQIVVVDRNGVIRAQSGSRGDPNLENIDSLRVVIEGLLREKPTAASTTKGTNSPSRAE